MKTIRTDTKGWQKEMGYHMKRKEKFLIYTEDEKLAKLFQQGKMNAGLLKYILMGSASGAVVGGGAASVSAGATAAGGTAVVGLVPSYLVPLNIVAMADPEPVSKTILISVCVILGAVVGGIALYGIWCLFRNKYKFKSKVSFRSAAWEFEAEPA